MAKNKTKPDEKPNEAKPESAASSDESAGTAVEGGSEGDPAAAVVPDVAAGDGEAGAVAGAPDAGATAPSSDGAGGDGGAGAGEGGGHEQPAATGKQPAEDPTEHSLTPEERERVANASDEQLRSALKAPDMPDVWRLEITAELERRTATQAVQSRKTFVRQYAVVRGGRFVVNGAITTLATGSIITPDTHDMREVISQGIAIRELGEDEEVAVGKDELGNQTARVQRKA